MSEKIKVTQYINGQRHGHTVHKTEPWRSNKPVGRYSALQLIKEMQFGLISHLLKKAHNKSSYSSSPSTGQIESMLLYIVYK